MKAVYLGNWSDKEDVERDFSLSKGDLKHERIIVAGYEYIDYGGEAFVLYEANGKLYEVNGCHCSCYGLEDQWTPEEVSYEALEHRVKQGTLSQYIDEVTGLKLVRSALRNAKRRKKK